MKRLKDEKMQYCINREVAKTSCKIYKYEYLREKEILDKLSLHIIFQEKNLKNKK